MPPGRRNWIRNTRHAMPRVAPEQAEAIESTAITFAIGALWLLDGLHCASVGGRCEYQVGLLV
jgi:hypothetical protein